MVLGDGLGIESCAPITNFDTKPIRLPQKADRYSLALAVLAGIRQGLLGNPIDGIFQGRVQPLEIESAAEIDLRPLKADL